MHSIRTDTLPSQPKSLFIHSQRLKFLRHELITPRALFLIAHVDEASNPYSNRFFEDGSPVFKMSAERVREVFGEPAGCGFTSDGLRNLLRATDQTVRNTIKELTRLPQGLLTHRKMTAGELPSHLRHLRTAHYFKASTLPVDPDDRGYLMVPKFVQEAFFNGTLKSPMEMFLVAKVASFRNNGCYVSNAALGQLLGLSEEWIREMIDILKNRGILDRTTIPHAFGKNRSKRILSVTE